MGINFRELKTTIFRENKLSRILENRIFRGIKLSRICQNSRKSRKFLPHYFLPLKYNSFKIDIFRAKMRLVLTKGIKVVHLYCVNLFCQDNFHSQNRILAKCYQFQSGRNKIRQQFITIRYVTFFK